MKIRKQITGTLAAVALAFLLGGCGKNEDAAMNESIQETLAESSMSETTQEASAESIVPESTSAAENQSTQESTPESTQSTEESGISASQAPAETADASTPYGQHGALHVDGANLVDASGEQMQLYGMSTHGIAWYPQYVNYDAFVTLRDDWNTNCVRLAMYTYESGGYCTDGDQENLKNLIRTGVESAVELGMYVIVDWHVLQDQNPNTYKEQAIEFFREISAEFADYGNVLYEICNEPNSSASWSDIKSYAEEVIPVIRENAPDAVIIVGTPTWSQDIDQALADPVDAENVMYALHFYAGTHKDSLRERLETCVQNGLPVFVSEFGMCDASGSGANDYDSTEQWFSLIEQYNLSFCCWSLGNKDETCCVIRPDSTLTSGWPDADLTETGLYIRDYFKNK